MKEPNLKVKNGKYSYKNIKKHIKSAINLPQLSDGLNKQQISIDNIESKLSELKESTDKNASLYVEIMNSLSELHSKEEISHNSVQSSQDSKYFASNHLLDNFYLNFENEFRGSPELIRERLLEYVPLFKDTPESKDVLDIGCGRGEFLRILQDNKVSAMGVDLNESMIKECDNQGLRAINADAIKYLSDAKTNQFAAITAFHFVEHIYFDDLLVFINECYRTLDDKGFVLFETPNPSNLSVGAHTFYLDPSHLRPLPPNLLAFAMKTVGFRDVEIKLLHPENEFEAETPLETELYRRVFGARDYAVIARK